MRARQGLSLLETVVAVGVLGLVLLALVGVLISAFRGAQQAAKTDEALGVARQVLDLVRVGNLPEVAPINDPATARVPLEAAPFTANFPAGTGYTRNLQMVRQDTNPANYGYLLFEVTVNLYWESKGVEHSVTLKGLHRAP